MLRWEEPTSISRGRIFATRYYAWFIHALVVGFILTGVATAAPQSPAAVPPETAPSAAPTSGPGAPAPAAGTAPSSPGATAPTLKSPCDLLDQLKDQLKDQQLKATEQRFAKQLFDSARLPQPFHGVLSSNVLPAEGLSRLTIDSKLNEVQKGCVMGFLVDDAEGLVNLRRLHFRSINVDVFTDTASGTESTRIFFTIPVEESPRRWFYKSVTLILGAYPTAGGDPIFSFSLPVNISSRTYSRDGGIAFGVIAYLFAALAAWRACCSSCGCGPGCSPISRRIS
jgi:hypothetical protein